MGIEIIPELVKFVDEGGALPLEVVCLQHPVLAVHDGVGLLFVPVVETKDDVAPDGLLEVPQLRLVLAQAAYSLHLPIVASDVDAGPVLQQQLGQVEELVFHS